MEIGRAISLCATVLSLLIILLAIIALAEPWWVYCESMMKSGITKRYQGFWRSCTDINGQVACSEIRSDDWNDWEKVTLAMVLLRIFFIAISFIMSITPPRLNKVKMAGAGINILAGVFFMVGGSVFGAKGKDKNLCSKPYLGSCFILGIICLILSFINACVFAAATAIKSNRRSSVSIHQQILDVNVS
ncbi:hypothetical protein CHS0354_034612 [Potamilus streckersoni]|nr:hypothetical protein CHS0354_034612 [Potamilus streckersoni]